MVVEVVALSSKAVGHARLPEKVRVMDMREHEDTVRRGAQESSRFAVELRVGEVQHRQGVFCQKALAVFVG